MDKMLNYGFQISETMTATIDKLVRKSLFSLVKDIRNKWHGRERETISLYAFMHLQKLCCRKSILKEPSQICIEGAVPQIKGYKKPEVWKDLIIWPRPKMSCFKKDGNPFYYPLVVMEWKLVKDDKNAKGASEVAKKDTAWLQRFLKESEGKSIGYSIVVCAYKYIWYKRIYPGKETKYEKITDNS